MKRLSLNPVTIKGKATVYDDAKALNITIGRLPVPADPKDGQQKVGDAPSFVMCALWEGNKSQELSSFIKQVVVTEDQFLEALCLLFPDKLAHIKNVKDKSLFLVKSPEFGEVP